MKLNSNEKKMIIQAIEKAERETSGEIRVHLSYSLHEAEPLQQAQIQFQKLNMHQTTKRNGILLYINPRARKFAVFGDQGINEKLGQHYWEELKDKLKQDILSQGLTSAIVNAVQELGKQLKTHFPFMKNDKNELKNDLSESD